MHCKKSASGNGRYESDNELWHNAAPTITPSVVAPDPQINAQTAATELQLPATLPPVVAPQVNPQTDSLLFSLSPERRNRINNHLSAPVKLGLDVR